LNLRQLQGLLSLGLAGGSQISLVVEGEDEVKASADLVEFIKNGFEG